MFCWVVLFQMWASDFLFLATVHPPTVLKSYLMLWTTLGSKGINEEGNDERE